MDYLLQGGTPLRHGRRDKDDWWELVAPGGSALYSGAYGLQCSWSLYFYMRGTKY